MNCCANLSNLVIYRALLADPIINALRKPKEFFAPELEGLLLIAAEENGFTGIIPLEYLLSAIVHENNIFSSVAEKNGGKVGEGLACAAAHDVLIMREFADDVFTRYRNHTLLGNYTPTVFKPLPGRNKLEKIFLHAKGDDSARLAVGVLCRYYNDYGYGAMLDNGAFAWDGESQRLIGTKNYSAMTFNELYGYEYQKQELIRNTEAFLSNKPANNVLLFGDRGTGKSSSIKAIGNKFFARGLRMVEVKRQNFAQLPKVMQELSCWGKKFIVVLDDLSFEEFEVEYKTLKSILDGGLEVKPDNVLFYATSNRRNIVKEMWQDQNMNELHSRDSINEKISLADRFGIKLFFDSMDQQQYFQLLENKAALEGLDISKEDLRAAAVKWEMSHTGRNGRIARQLLDYLHCRS